MIRADARAPFFILNNHLIPADAGIQTKARQRHTDSLVRQRAQNWIPASAGMRYFFGKLYLMTSLKTDSQITGASL